MKYRIPILLVTTATLACRIVAADEASRQAPVGLAPCVICVCPTVRVNATPQTDLTSRASGEVKSPGKPTVPPDSRKVLAVHKTDAEFTGIVKQPCRHLTAECPDKCDHGGDFAQFKILAYRSHEKLGQYGEDKAKTYSVRVRNSRGETRVDATLLAKIDALNPGDRVELDWSHDYVTRAGASFPERLITRIEPDKKPTEKDSVTPARK